MFNLQDKKLATTQDSQALQNSDESSIVSIGCYVWVLSTRLSANRDCLLKLYAPMLGKSARTVSREFYL